MDKIEPFDWQRLLIGNQEFLYYGEIIFRVFLIYFFTLTLFTFLGNRGKSDLSTMDYITLIVVGSAIGDVLFYPEVPLTYAMLIVLLVVILTKTLAYIRMRIEKVKVIMLSKPIHLIHDGKFIEDNLCKAQLSEDQIYSKLRLSEIRKVEEVEDAYLELNGDISIFKK